MLQKHLILPDDLRHLMKGNWESMSADTKEYTHGEEQFLNEERDFSDAVRSSLKTPG